MLRHSSLLAAAVSGLFSMLVAAGSSAAETSLLYHLDVPSTTAQPSATIRVQLVALNRSAGDLEASFPEILAGRFSDAGARLPIELRADEPGAASALRVAAGSFALRAYTMKIPPGASPGSAVVDVRISPAEQARAVVEIEPSSGRTESVDTQRPPTNLVRARPAAAALRRTFADRLGAHEPIYFVYGPDAPAAKFQFSFKYKLLDFRSDERRRMLRTLQFGFTQRSLWDIEADSSPFYDTSYMPEIIFESLASEPERSHGWFTWLGFQTAFKHESNGRDGPLSRSLNVAYVRAGFAFGRLEGWHLLAIPEVFTYLSDLEDNPGLEDYRGYGKLRLVFGRNDGPALSADLWAGQDFKHGSLQLDFTVPMRTRLLNFETYLHLQYFNGYGESLLSYDLKTDTVRAGFSIVR